MVVSTVFPEMMMKFAETITQVVGTGQSATLPPEDAHQIAAVCREIRLRMESFEKTRRQELAHGVDVATFKAKVGLILPQVEKLAAEMEHAQGVAPEGSEVAAEFALLAQAVARIRDLFRNIVAILNAPRPPIDWKRVKDAQAAYSKGDTKPFSGAQEQNGN
jgi:hypothetical protein